MSKRTVFITDYTFANLDSERSILNQTGCEITHGQCKTAAEVIEGAKHAEVLMVQWAPITAEVIASLAHCKLIVRYGIGVDNVDLAAAKARGIAVCNVPDYSLDEVADHAVSLAVSLGRQLPQLDKRLRDGVWKLAPVTPMPAFRESTFAVAGFGRIGREVLDRVKGFKFKLAAYDPFVSDERFAAAGVRKLSLDELFTTADILSLHLPLTAETRHLVNAQRLALMKPSAIIVNTARGGLIDTEALSVSLNSGQIGYAGLTFLKPEPLPEGHSIRRCSNAIITSHMAWYSEKSLPQLQRMAAEETARFLRGEALKNRVN